MIDTDKYEGHTEGPWIPQVNSQVSTAVHANAVHYVPSRAVTIIATVEYNHPQNKALIADAPLLLAEVKQLQPMADELIAIWEILEEDYPHVDRVIVKELIERKIGDYCEVKE